MLTEIPAEQFAAAVEAVVEQLLLEAEWSRPPVDALQIARRLELVVARDDAMDVRARFVRLQTAGGAGRGTILLGDDSRAERRQWAVAHEVGESVAQLVFGKLGVELNDLLPTAREYVANQLAAGLLLPREWLAIDGPTVDWDLVELKKIYTTASHELIARRMLQLRTPVILTLFDQGALQWRLSNAYGRPPRMSPAEIMACREAFETGRAAECDLGQLPIGVRRVRCWAVHEPGWRREIVRTELEDI